MDGSCGAPVFTGVVGGAKSHPGHPRVRRCGALALVGELRVPVVMMIVMMIIDDNYHYNASSFILII
jgi:hypothetical protein